GRRQVIGRGETGARQKHKGDHATKEKGEETMDSLIEKVAIITGASAGIGRAIAERLAQEGATVVVNYGKSADKAKQVVAGIEAKGGKAVAIQADMSKIADVRRVV